MGYCKPGDPCYDDLFKDINKKLLDLGVNLPESVMSPSDPVAADFINCFNISTDSLCSVISACTSGITSGGSSKYVESGNADAASQTLSFTYSDASTFNVANSVALFSDNDINVTGGTYNPYNGCVTFITNSGTSFDLCGFLTGFSTTITACTITTDILKPCTTGLTITSNLVVDGKTFISGDTHIDDSLFVSGDTHTRGDISLIDNGQILLGNGGDLSITHNSIKSIITNTTGELLFQNDADNADIRFKGTDDTSTITALTLDMSEAGDAAFNSNITIENDGKLKFMGTAGGSDNGINYEDTGSAQRLALFFPGSNVVALSNRASNGVVQIRANTSTAGGGGETTVAQFQDDVALFYKNVNISKTGGYFTVSGATAVNEGLDVGKVVDISERVYNEDKSTYLRPGYWFRTNDGGATGVDFHVGAGDPSIPNKTFLWVRPKTILEEGGNERDMGFAVMGGADPDTGVMDTYPTEILTLKGSNKFIGVRNTNPLAALSVNGVISGNTDIKMGGTLSAVSAIFERNVHFSGNTYMDDNLFVSGTTNLRNDVFITDGDLQVSGHTRLDSLRVNQYIEFDYSDGSTFIGYTAGQYHDSNSDYNTAVGHQAMALGTMNGADKNIALGHAALSFLTEGDNNIGIGSQSAGSNSTGSDNIAIGTQALFQNNINNYNIGIGGSCMYFSNYSIGDTHNVGIGYSTQYYSVYGRHNTSVGNYTLGNGSAVGNLGGTGNTAMGFRCLSATTTAAYNTAIGWQAGSRLKSGRSNIIIGQNAQVHDGAGDYQLNIGDVIYGQVNVTSGQTAGKIVVSGSTMINNNLFVSGTTHLMKELTITDGFVGVGLYNPKTALSVVNDYNSTTFESQLSDGEGGGRILKYSPGADDTLTVGQLYFLHTDGTWDQTDADAVATGASQLLGIGLGNARSVGVLLEGFVRIPSTEILNTPGSGAVDGLPVYVSTTAGHLDFTAPSASDDFIRVVGYAIDDDSSDVLIYFDPDKTWVELT